LATLEVSGLEAGYGRARVLFGVAIEARAGEVTVLAGRNGAGKSTTLKAIMGLIRPSAGRVRFSGDRIDGLAPFDIARRGVGYVPEDRRIFPGLTVVENLEVGALPERRDAGAWTLDKVFDLFPGLRAMTGRLGASLSGGEQQMLAIARTLMGNPAVLLLDEPSEGLAPRIVEDVRRAILQMKAAGIAILLSEQNVAFARHVADRAYVLEQGQVRFSGPASELRENLFP
jgi:branched-chain amino acid transport system ATP-binding protein